MLNKFKLYFGTILCKFTNKIFVCIIKSKYSGKNLIYLGGMYHDACSNAIKAAGFDYKYKNVFWQGGLIATRSIIKGERQIGQFELAQKLEDHLKTLPEKLP